MKTNNEFQKSLLISSILQINNLKIKENNLEREIK